MPKNPFTQLYTQFPKNFYSEVAPEPLVEGKLIHHHQELCTQLGIDLTPEQIREMTCGESIPEGLQPIAQKYTGHQFGYYNPDLGDGRGLLLGQVKDAEGQHWDLHLKGAGRTPYSRRGDGRAVLRSAVREYLIGEALHALGVPTTRCIALCTSNEQVHRELFEPRASYIRVAKTHIRFGHFEWLAQQRDIKGLKQLCEYVIDTVYPELKNITDEQSRYAKLLTSICERTANLIAQWQTVGFCHGVMNTDNMSVAGETFDFGPYAFLDDCKVHYICNHSDTEGRYAYSQQPGIALWNCQVLASAFSELISSDQIDDAINSYIDLFNQQYIVKMGSKLGLVNPQTEDKEFIADSLILLDQSSLDFHRFFYLLQFINTAKEHKFLEFVPDSKAWKNWLNQYKQRIEKENEAKRIELISNNAPQLVLRNYIAQHIIEKTESGHWSEIDLWVKWLKAPFHPKEVIDDDNLKHFVLPPKHKSKGIALSCSS